jgi:hypothetical protein
MPVNAFAVPRPGRQREWPAGHIPLVAATSPPFYKNLLPTDYAGIRAGTHRAFKALTIGVFSLFAGGFYGRANSGSVQPSS